MRTTSRHGDAFVGAPSAPPPCNDRRVSIRVVECPDCKAGVGEPCSGLSKGSHNVRRRMAVRLHNEQGTTANRLPVPSARQIYTARIGAGLSQGALGDLLGTGHSTVWAWEHKKARPQGDYAARLAEWFRDVTTGAIT